jgi:hypothetical protein
MLPRCFHFDRKHSDTLLGTAWNQDCKYNIVDVSCISTTLQKASSGACNVFSLD